MLQTPREQKTQNKTKTKSSLQYTTLHNATTHSHKIR